jgi:hypothetical protein
MKRALAIVCCLLLVWTQFVVLAQAPSSGESVSARACCRCNSSCCATVPSSPVSSPVSTAPVSSSTHLLTFVPAALVWTLPRAASRPSSAFAFASPLTPGAPLYARNCALLI